MIAKLISDIATGQIIKQYMIFHIIGRNRNRFILLPKANYIIKRRIQCCAKKPKRFNWFTDADTFANFVLESNLHKLARLPFSSASSRMRDEYIYKDLSIDRSMDIF